MTPRATTTADRATASAAVTLRPEALREAVRVLKDEADGRDISMNFMRFLLRTPNV